eukprot:TRINITY_DN2938_c0_g1_i3.p2 TRINITY_DN2938_c0_g1~~TRINITY_DN2938_c0_g1_i3.p2  ORF type:complete len:116 (+),score=28.04 TRINITY_DN2938_c0_g1_i3:32-349(+)
MKRQGENTTNVRHWKAISNTPETPKLTPFLHVAYVDLDKEVDGNDGNDGSCVPEKMDVDKKVKEMNERICDFLESKRGKEIKQTIRTYSNELPIISNGSFSYHFV